MLDPLLADHLPVGPGHRRQRVVLVGIERDILHLLRLLSAASAAGFPTRTIPRAREAQRFHPSLEVMVDVGAEPP
jgi:hypothetical protein